MSDGEFRRDQDYITTRISADARDGYPVEPGRYRVINPSGIVPAGPDLSGRLAPPDRDRLGGRPFGDGAPPNPPPPSETVPAGHTLQAG